MSDAEIEARAARYAAATKAIKGNFDRAATPYTSFEAQHSFFAPMAEKLLSLAPLPRGARVLDVGCGTGASTLVLAEAVGASGQVVGIDVSPGMLKEAEKNLPGTVSLACIDGCAFADSFDAPFDAVVYNAVLFMLPDAEGSLACARKVLKPGGAVLASMLDGVFAKGNPVADLLTERGFEPGRHALSPWSKVRTMLEAGFEESGSEAFERELSPALFKEFYGLEPMSAGLLPRLPYPERRAAVEELAEFFEREGISPVQRWVFAWARKR